MATNLLAGLDFNADWYHFQGTVTTGRTDPNGGTGAAKFIPGTNLENHNFGYDKSGLASAARKVTLYLSGKPAGYNCHWAYLTDGGANYRGIGVDFSTGTIGSNAGNGTATILNTFIVAQANGFYRFRLVVSLPTSTTISTLTRSADNSNVDFMAGDGTSGVDIFDAALYDGQVMEGFSAAFTLTGTAAVLKKGSVVAGASGAFTETGTAASLVKGSLVGASSGSYSLSGTAATLTYTPIGGYTLTAASGAFAETGTAAGLYCGRVVATASGSFVETGTAAALTAGRTLPAAFAQFTLTGQDATLTKGALNAYTLTALGGAYVWAGGDVTFLGRTWTPVPPTAETWTAVPITAETWVPA